MLDETGKANLTHYLRQAILRAVRKHQKDNIVPPDLDAYTVCLEAALAEVVEELKKPPPKVGRPRKVREEETEPLDEEWGDIPPENMRT